MKHTLIKRGATAVLCAVCIIVGSCFAFAAVTGDFNGDGRVDASDARALLRISVGLDTIDAAQFSNCDIDLDGKISASDARLALRMSVNLNDYIPQDEYELLRGETFYTQFNITSGSQTFEQGFAVTESSFYLPYGEDGMSLEILCDNGVLYLVNSEEKTAIPFTKEAFGEISKSFAELAGATGMEFETGDIDDMFSFSSEEIGDLANELFPDFGPLSAAETVGTETLNGTECKVYIFRTDNSIGKVYLNGRKLVRIALLNTAGAEIEHYDFSFVSSAVPSQYSSISGYKIYRTGDDMVEFLLTLML